MRFCAFRRAQGVTLFMVMLAALDVLLHRYTGVDDIAVGTPIANRTDVATEQVIGLFANTLVLRTDLSGEPTHKNAAGLSTCRKLFWLDSRRLFLNSYCFLAAPFFLAVPVFGAPVLGAVLAGAL